MNSIVGLEVFCKRNGARGVVEFQDGLTTTIILESGISKTVTNPNFKRWWTVVPQEQDEQEEPKAEATPPVTEGETTGLALRDKFRVIIRNLGLEQITLFHNEEKRTDVIKYRNRNIFELRYTNTRLTVLANHNSLTADNRKRATKRHPDSYGWTLDTQYVFTDINQWPLMKSIIADGVFYRKEQFRD